MSWLLTLLGCLGGTPSRALASLPAGFTPTVVRPDVTTVFGFDGGAFVPLAERRLAAFRVDGGAASPVGPAGPGWYRAVDHAGEETWAVVAAAREDGQGSTYRLLVGRGADWQDRGPIPATSLTAVRVAGEGVGWVVGVQQLWRTADGGGSWTQVVGAPAPGNVAETLGARPGGLVVGGARLLSTGDAGQTWQTLLDTPVVATDGGWVVTGANDAPRVGRVEAGAVRWTGALPAGWLADAVRGDDTTVAVRANKVGTSRLSVFTSADAGVTFTEQRLSGVSDASWVGLDGGVWWVDVNRRVHVLGR